MANWYLIHLFIGFLAVVYFRKEIRQEKFWTAAGMVFNWLFGWSWILISFGLVSLWNKIKSPLKRWFILHKDDFVFLGYVGGACLVFAGLVLISLGAQSRSEYMSKLEQSSSDLAKVSTIIHEIRMDEIDQRFYEMAMTSYASGDTAPLNKWIESCQRSRQSGILPKLPDKFERTDVVKIGGNAILVPSPIFPN